MASAQVSDDVVKIGVLTDMTGPASTPTGQGSVTAAQMAIDDFGGKVLGKPIQLVVGNHQLKPDIGASIARQWYDVDKVDLILDVPVSSVGLAVQSVANEKHKMMITHSTGSTDFHGKPCSPYTMQWVFDTRAGRRHRTGNYEERRQELVLHHRRLCFRPLPRSSRQ
jgi:branched-chain amino acid transport system substrate-binding protein